MSSTLQFTDVPGPCTKPRRVLGLVQSQSQSIQTFLGSRYFEHRVNPGIPSSCEQSPVFNRRHPQLPTISTGTLCSTTLSPRLPGVGRPRGTKLGLPCQSLQGHAGVTPCTFHPLSTFSPRNGTRGTHSPFHCGTSRTFHPTDAVPVRLTYRVCLLGTEVLSTRLSKPPPSPPQ